MGRSPPNPGSRRVEVPRLLTLAGRAVPDRSQAPDQVGRAGHLGAILTAVPAAADGTDGIGWPCWWTPSSAGLTSAPPEPGRGGSRSGRTHRPCAWTPPQRPEHTDPPRLRQPCTTPGLRVTVGQAGDALAIETRHGRYPCSAKRTRKPRTRPDSVLPDRAFRPGPSGPVFLVGASALSFLSRPTGSAAVCGEAAPAVAAPWRSP